MNPIQNRLGYDLEEQSSCSVIFNIVENWLYHLLLPVSDVMSPPTIFINKDG